VSDKKIPVPKWWKNTYFAIAVILFIVGICGLPFVGGENAIRDPGQQPDSGLVIIYWVAAIVMLVNGVISHRATVQHYREQVDGEY
jgi:hypothetical protein